MAEFNLENVGRALQGFGAGVAGRGEQFIQGQADRKKALSEERLQASFTDGKVALGYFQNGDINGVGNLLKSRLENIQKLGGDPSDTMNLLSMQQRAQAGDPDATVALRQELMGFVKEGENRGYLKAAPTMTPFEARRIKLMEEKQAFDQDPSKVPGFETKGGKEYVNGTVLMYGKGGKTIVRDPMGKLVPESKRGEVLERAMKAEVSHQQNRSGGRERGTLMAQLELLPEVKTAVERSKLMLIDMSNIKKENRSNAKSIEVYQAGVGNLQEALGQTRTGYFSGMLPAMTDNAQIADASVAMMAPMLKAIFRTTGEGTFTDQDQKMLMALIPTRGTNPGAVAESIKMIDDLIMAKLAPEEAIDLGGSSDPKVVNKVYNPATGEFE